LPPPMRVDQHQLQQQTTSIIQSQPHHIGQQSITAAVIQQQSQLQTQQLHQQQQFSPIQYHQSHSSHLSPHQVQLQHQEPLQQRRLSPQPTLPHQQLHPQSQSQSTSAANYTSTRSNTCHLCGRLFKSAKFLQVHLYCDHQQQSPAPSPVATPTPNNVSEQPQLQHPHLFAHSQSLIETQQRMDTIAPKSLNYPVISEVSPSYDCEICHKQFSDISSLQQHLLSHSAPRPYVCDTCDAGFTSASLLAQHIPTHHSTSQQIAELQYQHHRRQQLELQAHINGSN